MSTYLVSGRYAYREHAPGETFEATLDPAAEARALALGTITVVDTAASTIQPGSWRMPHGWPEPTPPDEQEE